MITFWCYWTYIANFGEPQVLVGTSIDDGIRKAFEFWSDDFKAKAVFHVFAYDASEVALIGHFKLLGKDVFRQ